MTHVDWHPYPEEKPKDFGDFLVTFIIEGDEKRYVCLSTYNDIRDTFFMSPRIKVIAWVEMPEPYRPEDKNE